MHPAEIHPCRAVLEQEQRQLILLTPLEQLLAREVLKIVINKKKTPFFFLFSWWKNAALPIENIFVILPPPKGEKTDSFVSVKAPGALLAAGAEQHREKLQSNISAQDTPKQTGLS